MRSNRSFGFTLIELVVILLIAGILAIAVIPRFAGRTGYAAREFHDRAVSALRYGARLASATRCNVTVVLAAGNPPSFSVQQPAGASCSGSQPAPAPTGSGGYASTADNGVALSGGATVTFTPSLTASPSGFPVTVSGGGFSGSINVIPATAYVQASP